jgi:hypothetical protein
MSSPRQFVESPIKVGLTEKKVWSFDTTPWGGSPSSPVVTVWQGQGESRTNVTSTVAAGSASVASAIIQTQTIDCTLMTIGEHYRVVCQWTYGGLPISAYLDIEVER